MATIVSLPDQAKLAPDHTDRAMPLTVRAHINRRRSLLILSGLLSILGNAAGLVPYLIVYFVAVEIVGRPLAEINASWLWVLVAVALGSVVLKAAATGFATRCSHIAAYDILYDLRITVAEKLGMLPLGYFNGRTTGEIKKVIHEDIEQLEEGLAHLIPDLVGGLTVPLVTVAVLFAVDWRLALATIALLPLAIVMYGWVTARSGTREYNALNAKMNGAVIQYINGMKVLKTFLRADASFAKLRDVAEELRAYYLGPYAASAPALAVILTVVRANLLLIVPLGVIFYLGGSLSLPTFVLFLVLGIGFNRPIWTLFSSYGTAAWQVATASEHIETLLREPALYEPATPQTPTDATIVFDNVSFSYTDPGTKNQEPAVNGEVQILDSQSMVLDGVSFTIPHGSVTALVGPSGAGKSTIAKLIPRFWDVSSGRITLGGVDIRQISTQHLMDQVGFVFQDVFLFNDTVFENIRVGKPTASEAEVIAAATAARCDDFIQALPQKYHTHVGENGARLSGGQRQRLSIARAILKDAPVVVLDEATAFLDPENEAQVQEALATLVQAGKTVVIIAHRLSTITEVDQVLVIEHGSVAARGTHAELLVASPLYKNLWQAHVAAQDWQLVQQSGTSKQDAQNSTIKKQEDTRPQPSAFTNPYASLNPNDQLMRTLWRLVPNQQRPYARGLVWKILDGMCAAWPGFVVFLILLELFQQPVDLNRIWLYIAVLAALFVGQIVFNYLAQREFLQVVAGMHRDLRLFLADYLRRLPLGFFSRRDTGTIDSLFTTNIMFLDVRFPTDMFITGVVAPSLMFATMLFIDWRLALAAGIGIPLGLLILRAAMNTFGTIWAALRTARTQANSRMVEYIQGIAVIRSFNLGGERFAQFQQSVDQYRQASARTTTATTGAMISFSTAMELGYAVLLGLGVALVLDGSLAPQTLLLFLFLGLAFYQPLMALGELVAFQRIVENSVRNLNEFLHTPTLPEPKVGDTPHETSVVFEHVSFGYEEQRTENREPRTENREQRTENKEQRTENREQRTENWELGTENREQRTENWELGTENWEQRATGWEPGARELGSGFRCSTMSRS